MNKLIWNCAAAAELLCAVHKHTARVNNEEPDVMHDDDDPDVPVVPDANEPDVPDAIYMIVL